MSQFDYCLVLGCFMVFIFLLGVYAGRAAAWREGCWYVLGVDPTTVGPPPGKPQPEPEGMPAPPAYRTDVPAQRQDIPAKTPSGPPTRVVGRRPQLPPASNGRPKGKE